MYLQVHNAGIYGPMTLQRNKEGHELTMAINHFGPFLLTHLLLGDKIYFILIVYLI